MSPASDSSLSRATPLACPWCGAGLPSGGADCAQCGASAAWIDYMRARDFARVQFQAWTSAGKIDASAGKSIDDYYARTRHESGGEVARHKSVPSEAHLAPATRCWSCGAVVNPAADVCCMSCGLPQDIPATAHVRYLGFIQHELDKVVKAGILPLACAHACCADANGAMRALIGQVERNRVSCANAAAIAMRRIHTQGSAQIYGLAAEVPAAHGAAASAAATTTTAAVGATSVSPADFPPAPDDVNLSGADAIPSPQDAMRAATDQLRAAGDAVSALRSVRAQRAPTIPAPPAEPPAIQPARRPRRSLLEILLDPRSIQWLLASGGVLLVVGLVIWLASLGVFKNTWVIASTMGAGTLAVMATGWAVIRFTRYQLAGRALTLLACLVMPLNLWFYQWHGLMTIDGHLWVAGLVCCALYAASALLLADALFVYVLMGGVAATGLLILADMHRFAEVVAPSMLLVILGLTALHAERAFADDDGPFGRKRFGMAFFWSAQALLGAGLALLLGAQLAGWLFVPLVHAWGFPEPPLVYTDPTLKLIALVLTCAGAYAYVYSDLVVRRIGVYMYLAAGMMLWAEIQAIDVLNLTQFPTVLIVALAVTALAINLMQSVVRRTGTLARPLLALGLLLSLMPALYGVLLHFRATWVDLHADWPYSVTWGYVVAMALTAVCCRVSAHLQRDEDRAYANTYLFAMAASVLVGAAGLLSVSGLRLWSQQAPLLMLVAILYLAASHLERRTWAAGPLVAVAHGATAIMILSVLSAALRITHHVAEPVVGSDLNLVLALFCAEAAVFYGLATAWQQRPANVYLFTLMTCGAVWQLLNHWSVATDYYALTFASVGLALLIAYRLMVFDRMQRPALSIAAFGCANALMSLSFIAEALLALSRLARRGMTWQTGGASIVITLAILTAISLLAAALVRHPGWRRWYVVLGIAEAALGFITIQRMMHLSGWQNLELFCVAVGLVLLTVGHIAWYREQEAHSDMASFGLGAGALLAGVPLLIASLVNRFGYDISLIDELGLMTISVAMFVSGFMLRLRWTTLIGGALLGIHLLMLIVSVGMRAQLAVGVYLAIGGAVIFGTGLVLSVYRQRLLALPEQVRHREGVFQVLGWR